MNKPIVRILIAMVLLYIIVGILLLATGTPLIPVLLIPIGPIVGPFIFLLYPFGTLWKLGYIFVLAVLILLIAIGYKKRNHVLGQVLVVLGLLALFSLGFASLGAGI